MSSAVFMESEMRALVKPPRKTIRPSVSRRDLIPELGIAAAAVAITATAQWVMVMPIAGPPLLLFVATAAALTFWRGLGPGMLASSMGATVGPVLSAPHTVAAQGAIARVDTLLMFAGSMFTCWLIYRLRVDQEDAQAVENRRNDGLAFVSHELRQPLSSIKLAAAILERDRSDQTRNKVITLIGWSAARLATVVDDLADVSRLQSSAISVDPRVLRLQDVILSSADAARPAIEQKLQHLEIQVPLDPPLWINGDAKRLEQVLNNVLSNACKYSPEGAEISISSREDQGSAVIVVSDTGVGIRRDMRDLIFDPFVRESPTGSEGLGIGLALARNVITQHGGEISAHSEGPGRGSAFVIKVPLLEIPSDRIM